MSCCSSCLPTDSFCSPPKIFGRDLCMKPMKGSGDKVYIFVCLTVAIYIVPLLECSVSVHQMSYRKSTMLRTQDYHRYYMYICRTPTVFTGATCISVGLQVRHVYLSDYRIDIYICRISNNIIVPSPTYIFIGLLNITWTILLRSNIVEDFSVTVVTDGDF